MKKSHVEIIVGVFICVGLMLMAYTSVKLGQVDFFNNNYYEVKATFTSVTGLKPDTVVEISGVKVGRVTDIKLENYQGVVTMEIENGTEIQDDAIASIRTRGILGENYIEVLPGASDEILGSGDIIFDTEPPFDLLTVIKSLVVSE